MIFEAPRMLKKVERVSYRVRTDITDEFLESLQENSNLYQAYYMGKEEKLTKESVTVSLLEVYMSLNDIELTRIMDIARQMVGEKSA